jgi:adenylate cyclase
MDYTIVGGAVNLASRLEHECAPGGVLISYETLAHVRRDVRFQQRGHLAVKGIAYPVATYSVLGLKGEAGDPIRAELPHLRLELDPELMSRDERRQAAAAMREALEAIENSTES